MKKLFVLLSVLGMALAATACGSSSGVVAACEESCAKSAELSCENGIDNDTCMQSCAAYGMGIAPDSCLEAYETYATCVNALTWECNGMGMAGPADSEACSAETQAYLDACQSED